jgi:hypothetical protein
LFELGLVHAAYSDLAPAGSRSAQSGAGINEPTSACSQAAHDGSPAFSFRPTNYKSGSELFVAPKATIQQRRRVA